ncbi:MAG: hypothetical protein Q4C06_07065 [Bacillota bacterium]|nr:hypothetical protein [Bacillota bacterium]
MLAEIEAYWEVIDMEKNTNKNMNKNGQQGMSRTEFAQEYSIDSGKAGKGAGKNGTQKNANKGK